MTEQQEKTLKYIAQQVADLHNKIGYETSLKVQAFDMLASSGRIKFYVKTQDSKFPVEAQFSMAAIKEWLNGEADIVIVHKQ